MNQAISRSQLPNVLIHMLLREGKKNKREVAIDVIEKEESDLAATWRHKKKDKEKNHIKFENLVFYLWMGLFLCSYREIQRQGKGLW